uniref:Major facilitator superfamily (MFS) profile domain-containing protein n=1 Tax=Monopterus albus TaxID=43700 RepID=A0A3Q3QYB5_MONAL
MTDYEDATAFLGEWGRFQQQVFFFLCLSTIPHAAWRNSSIPMEPDSHGGALVPSECSRYKLDDLLGFSQRGLFPDVDVNLSTVPQEGCLDGWEYDRSVYTSTIVSEWDLVCDNRWKKPMTSSVFFCGVLTGSFISGQLSDRYGRKIVLFVNTAVQAVFMFLQFFSPSWTMFCAAHFIVGLGHISNYVAAFVLGTEILGPRVRIIFSTAGVCLFFSLGYMLLPLLAFFIREWRMLLLGLSLPGFLCLPLWWFIPESPRWLLSRGRIDEADAIVRDAAKKNKIEPPLVIFSPLQKELKSEKTKTHNICDLLRTANILPAVPSDLHIQYTDPASVVEIPAYFLSWLMFRWCPRRPSLFSTLLMGGMSLLFIQFIPANLISLAITFEMIGKFAVSTAYAVVYAYTAELYPTVLRNTAVGACSMAARIGSITAPYLIYLRSYSISLPYILIGGLTALSALLSLLLPESYGMPLPDTITHMQHLPR